MYKAGMAACGEKCCLDIRCPTTGGRVLVTHPPSADLPDGADPQRPHIDFALDTGRSAGGPDGPIVGASPTPTWTTSAFTMVTADVHAALRVYPSSHQWASASLQTHKAVAATSYPDLIWIPPYSVLIHGISLQNNAPLARWHAYWAHRGATLTNAAHYEQSAEDTELPDLNIHIEE